MHQTDEGTPLPIRIVWYLFGLLGALAVANAVVDSSSPDAHAYLVLFYACVAACGSAYALVALWEGYSLRQPSANRDEFPIFFWLDVTLAFGLAVMGARMMWASL